MNPKDDLKNSKAVVSRSDTVETLRSEMMDAMAEAMQDYLAGKVSMGTFEVIISTIVYNGKVRINKFKEGKIIYKDQLGQSHEN